LKLRTYRRHVTGGGGQRETKNEGQRPNAIEVLLYENPDAGNDQGDGRVERRAQLVKQGEACSALSYFTRGRGLV
jgi:hypothetical protein